VLFIALIVLVAMSLAGVALFRSVGTGVLIAGNIALQRAAVTSSDLGIESGRAWLMLQNQTTLTSDQTGRYYSSWDQSFDPSTFNWTSNSTLVSTDGAGFEIRYVIHRLCSVANASHNATNQSCISLKVSSGTSSRTGGSYGVFPLGGNSYIYFRITSRALGPKNTVSYTQTTMY
jgi:Tfp pilus assembly protein PilX